MTKEQNQPLYRIKTMPEFEKKEAVVIRYDKVSRTDEETLIRLYKAMTDPELKQDIDIRMLAEEAIPHFTEIIGENNMRKIWNFFARGYRSNNGKKEKEVYALLMKLTTVDNACYYISGFKDCIHYMADLLMDAPDDMSEMVKAKIMRAFMVIMGDYHFFAEDYALQRVGENEFRRFIVDANILNNNKRLYRPERLLMLYDLKLSQMQPGSFVYSLIKARIDDLEKAEKKDFYKFAELSCVDGKISDLNESHIQTYGEIRKLKMRVSPIVGKYPSELFVYEVLHNQWNFVEMYYVYRVLTSTDDWTSFPTVEEDETVMVGSRVEKRKKELYKVGDKDLFASTEEMKMFKRYFEFFVKKEYELDAYYRVKKENSEGGEEQEEEIQNEKLNLGLFMGAQKYFQEIGYYDPHEVNMTAEFFLADALFNNFDYEKPLRKFMANEIDAKQLRSELGIDAKAESEIFNLIAVEEPIDAFERFMSEEGFKLTDENREIAEKIIFEENKESFNDYAQQKIERKKLRKLVHFNEDVVKQMCDLSLVDLPEIEEYLMDLKRKSAKPDQIKRDTLLVKFYCYLVENECKCGPNHKKAKHNKSLKPSNLLKLIQ